MTDLEIALAELDRCVSGLREAIYAELHFEKIATSMEVALEKLGEYFRSIIKW